MRFNWSAKEINESSQAAELAARFQVNCAITDNDYLFNALMYSSKENIQQAYDQYIADGRRNAEQIQTVIEKHLVPAGPAGSPLAVLDFAAGYGRVARHFRNVAPHWRLEAADIHPEACAFNRDELGVKTHLSSYKPDALAIPAGTFDAVFCLSFFSHLRDEQFVPWLRALLRLVREDGVLVITTHGERSIPVLNDITLDESGYGMLETSEQFDIPTDYYVHACTTRSYVERQLAMAGSGKLETFEAAAWWLHQDMYVIRRGAEPAPNRASSALFRLGGALRRRISGLIEGTRAARSAVGATPPERTDAG